MEDQKKKKAGQKNEEGTMGKEERETEVRRKDW